MNIEDLVRKRRKDRGEDKDVPATKEEESKILGKSFMETQKLKSSLANINTSSNMESKDRDIGSIAGMSEVFERSTFEMGG